MKFVAQQPEAKKGDSPAKMADEVTPIEDLMREHGGLRRLLLVYEEVSRQLGKNRPVKPELLGHVARLIRQFVEDYHEKMEEDHVFPRLVKAGKLVELTKVLLQQHQAGRRLTTNIERAGKESSLPTGEAARPLRADIHKFVRMYRPHASREDTILFPALHGIMTAKEYDVMGDQFEDREHELFGKEGFEKIIVEVAELERRWGFTIWPSLRRRNFKTDLL